MFDPEVLCGSELSGCEVKLFNNFFVCCDYGTITVGTWIKHKLKLKFFCCEMSRKHSGFNRCIVPRVASVSLLKWKTLECLFSESISLLSAVTLL